MSLEVLQQRLGYAFRDPALLRQALTHRSYGKPNNERLEFLGDSVLNCVVASLLYHLFARIDEGDLSRLRATLVRQQALHEIAQRLELSGLLLLGEGEQKSGGSRRPSILADSAEAIFGAVLLDGGFDAAHAVISALYDPILKTVDPHTLGKDAKTLLQEYLQGRRVPLPVYAVVATHGAAHNQVFEVECAIPKLGVQVLGTGGSRRAAEQAAAKKAIVQAQALLPAAGRRKRAAAPDADGADARPTPQEAPAATPGAPSSDPAAPGAPSRHAVIVAPSPDTAPGEAGAADTHVAAALAADAGAPQPGRGDDAVEATGVVPDAHAADETGVAPSLAPDDAPRGGDDAGMATSVVPEDAPAEGEESSGVAPSLVSEDGDRREPAQRDVRTTSP